jgi:MoxR-like ATPase
VGDSDTMSYTKLFDPKTLAAADANLVADQSDGRGYVFNDRIVLAVNTAMATGRPLLVRGDSGVGKSSLAAAIAAQLDSPLVHWRKLDRVISSRTEARDLLWEVDHLRRLQDAHDIEKTLGEPGDYVQPGILWWAFDAESAEKQYARAGGKGPRFDGSLPGGEQAGPAVVLLDEIDKADPDLPNNLLVPIGSLKFHCEPTQEWVIAKPDAAPLLVITSNDERELPAAFLRRCVELVLELPSDQTLLEIGERRFPKLSGARRKRVLELIVGSKPKDWQGRATPVPAEYLDALRAVSRLTGEEADLDIDALLESIAPLLVWKTSQNNRS